ncbi:hypothetical protein VTO42DRAFT_8276 [Malbranchea cinnamomea]
MNTLTLRKCDELGNRVQLPVSALCPPDDVDQETPQKDSLSKIQSFKYHQTTEDMLANSPIKGSITILARHEQPSRTPTSRWNHRNACPISLSGNIGDNPFYCSVNPQSVEDSQLGSNDEYKKCPVLHLESCRVNKDGGDYKTHGNAAGGHQHIASNTTEFDGQRDDSTLGNPTGSPSAQLTNKLRLEPATNCVSYFRSQNLDQRSVNDIAHTQTAESDDEFEIDPEVFRELQSADESRTSPGGRKNSLIYSSSICDQKSPASPDKIITCSGNRLSETRQSYQGAVPLGINSSMKPSHFRRDRNLSFQETIPSSSLSNLDANGDQIECSEALNLTTIHAPTTQDPIGNPATPPLPQESIQGKDNMHNQRAESCMLRPFVRRAFPGPVADRSPVQGLTSTHTILRTCFRIGEALRVSGLSRLNGKVSPSPLSHAHPNPSSLVSNKISARGAGATILIELYAFVESSHRINRTQYFRFADLFFPSRPPYLDGIWGRCTDNSIFDADGRAFLGRGGREWKWNEGRGSGKPLRDSRETNKMQDKSSMEDRSAGWKMCRVVGIIEKTPTGNGGRGVYPVTPSVGNGVVMSVLSIWEANWSDVEHVKGIVEA